MNSAIKLWSGLRRSRPSPAVQASYSVIVLQIVKRTLLAVGFAVLASLLFVPYGGIHHGVVFNRGRSAFWDVPYDLIALTPFILQTVFAATAAAVIVNLLPRRPRK